MITGELFTVELKGVATSIAVTVNWVGVFVVTTAFPILDKVLGSSTCFWICSLVV